MLQASVLLTGLATLSPVSGTILRTVEDQHLTICSAFDDLVGLPRGLDVYLLRTSSRLTSSLHYKQCRDLRVAIEEGDCLDFRAGDLTVGVFKANDLPRSNSGLLVIPHRRDTETRNASFESHAFSEIGTSQLVVVDASGSNTAGKMTLASIGQAKETGPTGLMRHRQDHSEDLDIESVVAIKPGKYRVALQDTSNNTLVDATLEVGKDRSNYIVARIGDRDSSTTQKSSQDLIVHTIGHGHSVAHAVSPPNQSGTSAWAQPGFLAALTITLVSLGVAS